MVTNVKTQKGDIGVFEFQIKRGRVDEDTIEDPDVKDLLFEIIRLIEKNKHNKAVNLLMPKLDFEFPIGDLDYGQEDFFMHDRTIEFRCSKKNTYVRLGYDGELFVTIGVEFEIPLKEQIDIAALEEYIADSGAHAAAYVSPGWGYSSTEGDNVWLSGIRQRRKLFGLF